MGAPNAPKLRVCARTRLVVPSRIATMHRIMLTFSSLMTLGATFAPADWAVLAGYFVLLIVSGWWFSRKKQENTDDYFLADRQMPVWAVAISVVSTALSGATFVAVPAQAYAGNLTYLVTFLSAIIAILIIAIFFIPAYYRHNVSTVYELLEVKLGAGAKQASSLMFVVGRVFAEGSRLFIAALATSQVTFGDTSAGHMGIAIAALTVVAIFYTFVGGVRTVIFTDIIQLAVFTLAAGAALFVILNRVPADMTQIIDALQSPAPGAPSKLTIFQSGLNADGAGIDFTSGYTIITAMTGFLVLNLAAYGLDHGMAQRMLTCRSAVKGSASAVVSVLLYLPIVVLFMVVGLGLYVYYDRPDLMGAAAPTAMPTDKGAVFVHFILNEMPTGMKGALMAGLFAAALTGSLNSMSSAVINDLYRHIVRGREPAHYLFAGRMFVLGLGVLLGLCAWGCFVVYNPQNRTLLDFVLDVMSFAYSGMVAVFLTALFTRRGSSRSAMAALATGFVAVLLTHPLFWKIILPAQDGESNALQEYAAWCGQLAYPWRLLMATAAAMLVCLCGSRPAQHDRRAGESAS